LMFVRILVVIQFAIDLADYAVGIDKAGVDGNGLQERLFGHGELSLLDVSFSKVEPGLLVLGVEVDGFIQVFDGLVNVIIYQAQFPERGPPLRLRSIDLDSSHIIVDGVFEASFWVITFEPKPSTLHVRKGLPVIQGYGLV